MASDVLTVQSACFYIYVLLPSDKFSKAVQGQLERDNQLIDLVTTMENVYSFVDTLQEIPNKLLVLENVTMSILKQTVECAIFVREYTDHGFAGTFLFSCSKNPLMQIR